MVYENALCYTKMFCMVYENALYGIRKCSVWYMKMLCMVYENALYGVRKCSVWYTKMTLQVDVDFQVFVAVVDSLIVLWILTLALRKNMQLPYSV